MCCKPHSNAISSILWKYGVKCVNRSERRARPHLSNEVQILVQPVEQKPQKLLRILLIVAEEARRVRADEALDVGRRDDVVIAAVRAQRANELTE